MSSIGARRTGGLPTPRGRRFCTGDGGIGGEGRRGAEGMGSGGVRDMGGSRQEEAGRRGMEDTRGRKPTIVTDEQMGEKVADRVGHAATMGADDGGKDRRKLEEWGNAKRGGWRCG